MTRFLLDANLSPQTATHLQNILGLDVVHLRSLASGSSKDAEVVAIAQREHRVIVTFDTDFGEIFHFREHGRIGIIQLAVRDQTVENVNHVLEHFLHSGADQIDLDQSLVILEQDRVRVVRYT